MSYAHIYVQFGPVYFSLNHPEGRLGPWFLTCFWIEGAFWSPLAGGNSERGDCSPVLDITFSSRWQVLSSSAFLALCWTRWVCCWADKHATESRLQQDFNPQVWIFDWHTVARTGAYFQLVGVPSEGLAGTARGFRYWSFATPVNRFVVLPCKEPIGQASRDERKRGLVPIESTNYWAAQGASVNSPANWYRVYCIKIAIKWHSTKWAGHLIRQPAR